jgi:hypothetical protein
LVAFLIEPVCSLLLLRLLVFFSYFSFSFFSSSIYIHVSACLAPLTPHLLPFAELCCPPPPLMYQAERTLTLGWPISV